MTGTGNVATAIRALKDLSVLVRISYNISLATTLKSA
jgi:hypothetical protein